MAAITLASVTSAYYRSASTLSASSAETGSARSDGTNPDTTSDKATSVTLSDGAKASMAEKTLASVLGEARAKLMALLKEAGRASPLDKGQLALDLSSLDQRELYAIANDKSSSADERKAAGLEMQRRLDTALSGPLAVAQVSGDYTGLYKAAATYLDNLGTEEKASADWRAARDAVTEGLKQLQANPKQLPSAGEKDPVGRYLASLGSNPSAGQQNLETLAKNARTLLDKRYADARADGREPTFDRSRSRGAHIDLSDLSSRSLSAIILDKTGKFSAQEVRAAQATMREKSAAPLLSGLKSANQSGNPAAFSQNIISAYSSLSAEERQAAGWSDKMYESAVASFKTTSKLMQMFGSATGSGFSLVNFLGR
jgi:hypothetical protein